MSDKFEDDLARAIDVARSQDSVGRSTESLRITLEPLHWAVMDSPAGHIRALWRGSHRWREMLRQY
jgi:hypothetical protein